MGRNLGPLNIKDSYEGLVQISGSQLTDGSGSLISSLDVTASYATNAGYAGSSGTSGFATSASFATTASYALNVPTFDTGSLMVTGSVTDATLTFTKGDGSTFPLTVNNVANATSALLAVSASHAVNADSALISNTSTQSKAFRNDAGINYKPIFVAPAGGDGDKTLYFNQKNNILINPGTGNLQVTSITASIAQFDNLTATSASIGYLQTITGSAKIIGDAFIILNNDTPTERYAGIVVQDSGSGSPLTTSSFQYDGQTDDWFYEYSNDGGVTVDHGVAMFGPEYSVKGVPTYNTANTILKGDGGHHILDSKLTDDGGTLTYGGSRINFSNNSGNPSGTRAVIIGGFVGNASGIESGMFASSFGSAAGQNAVVLGGVNSDAGGSRSGILAGNNNTITSAGTWGGVVGGSNNTSQHRSSVVVGGENLSTTKASEVVVNHLSIYGDAIVDNGTTTGNVIDNIGQTVVSVEDAVQHIVHCTQAEYDAITPDANTLYVIDGAETLGDTNVDGKLTGTVNTISDAAGTTTLDCSVGNYFTLAMPAGGSTTLTPTNITAGQTINIKITQNATASTLAYAASIDFPGGTAFTISTGSGEVDILTLVSFDGTTLQATGLANFS